MGSGITQAYIAKWGAVVGETILTAESTTIIVDIQPGYNFLKVLMLLKSNVAGGGTMDWLWQLNDAFALHQTSHFYIEPPNVVNSSNFLAETAFRGPTLGDQFTWFFSEWTINQIGGNGILKLVIGNSGMDGGRVYQAYNNCLLDPGQSAINRITLIAVGAGKKFNTDSRVSVYGLN